MHFQQPTAHHQWICKVGIAAALDDAQKEMSIQYGSSYSDSHFVDMHTMHACFFTSDIVVLFFGVVLASRNFVTCGSQSVHCCL